jgi:hypothetical protein
VKPVLWLNIWVKSGENPRKSTDPTGLEYYGCGAGDLKGGNPMITIKDAGQSSIALDPIYKPIATPKLSDALSPKEAAEKTNEALNVLFTGKAKDTSKYSKGKIENGKADLDSSQANEWAGQKPGVDNSEDFFAKADAEKEFSKGEFKAGYKAAARAETLKVVGKSLFAIGIAGQVADAIGVGEDKGFGAGVLRAVRSGVSDAVAVGTTAIVTIYTRSGGVAAEGAGAVVGAVVDYGIGHLLRW